MSDNELLRYVRDQLNAGHSPEAIENVLLGSGYSASDVREVISESQGHQQQKVNAATKPGGTAQKIGMVLVLAAGALTIASGLMAFLGIDVMGDMFFNIFLLDNPIIALDGISALLTAVILGTAMILNSMYLYNFPAPLTAIIVSPLLILMGGIFIVAGALSIVGGVAGAIK